MTTVRSPSGPKGPSQPGAPSAETLRLSVLQSYRADGIEDDPELSAITTFAAELTGCPISLVSFVETERQRFLARDGLDALETPRSVSFCAHTMLGDTVMEVPDASSDPRFASNELVTGDMAIRFYAGAPLVSPEGAPLGALCVIDKVARPGGLTDMQRNGLRVLAKAVMRRLEARRFGREQRAHRGLEGPEGPLRSEFRQAQT